MSKKYILWVDDDNPKKNFQKDEFEIVTVRSCEKAVKLLNSGKIEIEWIIVDLVVNQGKWKEEIEKIPGLSFIEYVKKKYKDKIGIIVYSILNTDELHEIAMKKGADSVYAKIDKTFSEVIESLKVLKYRKDIKNGDSKDESMDK